MKTKLASYMKASTPFVGVLLAAATAQASTDYGPAQWYANCHYSTWGYGKRFFVEHDMEGYFWPSIYYLSRCSTSASIHYAVNGKKDTSSDSAGGKVVQCVRDANYAWHALCWNHYSMGTEHEGFARNPAWYTEALYTASASLTRSKCNKYGIAKDRNHVVGHGQKNVSGWPSWASSHLGINPYCNTHTDPGPYWKWGHFMDLVRGTVSTPSAPSSLTATTQSASRIDLKWRDNSGHESGFEIQRATSSGGPWTDIHHNAANDVTYPVTGLSSGTKYYFRVRAYNSAGNSKFTGIASATTKDVIPTAPSGLTATAVSNDQINLAWTDNSSKEDGFKVYRSTDGTTFALVKTVGINVRTWSNTGLTGNRKYWYRVYSYNTAGKSSASNTASDTTAPQAPTALTVTAVSGTGNWNKLNLAWTDNANAEVGFKIERATASAGPFSQIATNAASDTTYTDSGLSANTTYYYRVRCYNANGNSDYSNVASKGTPNAPPILNAIGNKTVAAGANLAFTATASDPNAPAATTTTWQTFESFAHNGQNETVLFNKPGNSGSTSAFMDTSTNYTLIRTNGPSVWGSGNTCLKAGWGFKTGMANYWVRLNTFNTPTNPNPTIALDQKLQFKVYPSDPVKIGLGVRESGTTAAYGANGGTTGSIEWVGVTNVVNGNPVPNRLCAATNSTTLTFNIPFEPQAAFTGDGKVDQSGAKGTLEHVIIRGEGGTGGYYVYFDDFRVITANNLVYSLDAGAPAGATIGRRNGKFSWTPTTAQVGVFNITVRVTDNLGGQDFETIKVTVTGTGNAAPVLAAIGSKTVKEGSNLAFTATATDANGNALTYSLDAGAPSGASINGTSGAFSWTPTEAQGPGSYPITVRVTDNGSPSSNDFETVTVTVSEVNNAPVLNAIADQTVNEGSTLTLTASATDSDVPANSITYTVDGPVGMSINASTGAITYTPALDDGGDVNQVTVTVKDNGSPALSASRTFNVTVNEVNNAPTIIVGTKSDLNPFAVFDELDDEGVDAHNNACMFRTPYFSASTTQYLDSTSYSYLTNDFPLDDVNGSYQALYVNMTFNTGTVNPWCRLTTFTSTTWTNEYAYPNPTINLGQHVRFKIWCDKSVKVAIGVRETGTGTPLGFNGGTTGTIEWVGATTVTNGSVVSPVPTRTITASNWTQVDFNLPAETIKAFPGSGNGALASGKGTLEHLAIVPNAGMGNYTIYVDDFETLTTTTANPITIDTLDTLSLICTASDPDLPAQNFLFSCPNLPTALVWDEDLQTNVLITNASFTAAGGEFTWQPLPVQSPSTNVITLTVTDDGTPAMSGSQNITVIVNKVNTPPALEKMDDQVVEGGTVTFDASAQDDDVPAQTLTYSLTSAPAGATINASTGTFTYTPAAGTTNTVTIRVTDNGSPALWDEQTVKIMCVPANTAPILSLGTARATESVFNFETFTNGTPNEQVLFKKPSNSATTASFIDTSASDQTTITTSFPANAAAGAKVLRADFTFKTGIANEWVRLNTFNTTLLPNPAINASGRLKFDVYSTKSIKVALGIRETGTTAENGANGGTTGTIEYVGVSGKQANGCPIPTRTVAANTWTTLEFDLPNEPKAGFTGDGILNGGQQVLEELSLVGTTTGAHTLYLDNFEVVTTTALPGTVNMKAGSTLTFTATASDPNPGSGINYGIDADFTDAHTNATIDADTGAFIWPTVSMDAGTTNAITVSAEDNPTNGGVSKSDSKSFTIIVNGDTLAPQSGTDGTLVGAGETVTLTWEAAAGATYKVQSHEDSADAEWIDSAMEVSGGSVTITNTGAAKFYRVVEVNGGAAGQ